MMSSASSYFVIALILRILKIKPDIISHIFIQIYRTDVYEFMALMIEGKKITHTVHNKERK